MFPPNILASGSRMMFSKVELEKSTEHAELTERFRKTLYYGKTPDKDIPSLAMTELAVDFFQESSPRKLGKVDTLLASSISRRACISPCAMMLGMIYIERLKNRNPEYLQQMSSSDLFLISMMVASKYLYDEGVDEEVFNDEWAESSNLDIEDINQLERDFLTAMDWGLFIHNKDFLRTLDSVERKIAVDKGLERGSFSYTDLTVLSGSTQLHLALWQALVEISKMLMVCSVTYYAGTATLMGSAASLVYLHETMPALYAGLPALTTSFSLLAAISQDQSLHEQRMDLPFARPVSELLVHEEINSTEREVVTGSYTTEMDNDTTAANTLKTEDGLPAADLKTSATIKKLNVEGLMTLTLLRDTVWQFLLAIRDGTSGLNKNLDQSSSDLLKDAPSAATLHCTCNQHQALDQGQSFEVSDVPASYIGKCVGPVNFRGCLRRIGRANHMDGLSASCREYCRQSPCMDSGGKVYKPFHDLPVTYGTRSHPVFG